MNIEGTMKQYPFLTFEEQLNLFEERGLKIKNREYKTLYNSIPTYLA